MRWLPRLRLTFHQRLLLLTAVPVLGFLGVGGSFLARLYEEYGAVARDLRTFETCETNLNVLTGLARAAKEERESALRLLAASPEQAKTALARFQSQHAATDAAIAALHVELDRLTASSAGAYDDKIKYSRDPLATISGLRAEVAAGKLTAAQVMAGYVKFTFNTLVISEAFRGQLRHPASLNFYDGLFTTYKLREQDGMVASLFAAAQAGYSFRKEDSLIVRKQYFAITEGETYLRRYWAALRAAYDPLLKLDETSVAYFKFFADVAATVTAGELPPFPDGRALIDVQRARYEHSTQLIARGFTLARGELATIAAERRRHTFTLAAVIVVTLALSVGVNLAVTRTVQRRLAAVSAGIGHSSHDVHLAADQLTGAGEQISSNASSYASALEEIEGTLKQVSAVARQNERHASDADGVAATANKSVSHGMAAVNELGAAMSSISQSSREITKIISKINGISFQTNILALNAAVEAARAGEAGAGFSVVADEVRRLAQMCADAAQETTRLIEESSRNAAVATDKSSQVTNIFKDISSNVRQVGQLVTQISQGFHQQTEGIQLVNAAVTKQERVAQSTAAVAEETAAAALTMKTQVENLEQNIEALEALLGRASRLPVGSENGDLHGTPSSETDVPQTVAAS